MANEEKKKKSKKQGSITAGFILLGIGLIFLLDNLEIIPGLDKTWPLFLIIIGASLLIGAMRDKQAADSVTPLPPTEPTPPAPIG